MTELVYGTTNPAKLAQAQTVLNSLGIVLIGLNQFKSVPDVDESGTTAEENARIKAIAYATALKRPVLSMDNALYLDGLADDKQPGLHVRRINGRDRTRDKELLSHYSKLVARLGDHITGYWRYGVAIAKPDGSCASTFFDTPRIFVSTPSNKLVKGYPLESLQVHPQTHKYIAEMEEQEIALFWQETVGEQLRNFVRNNFQ